MHRATRRNQKESPRDARRWQATLHVVYIKIKDRAGRPEYEPFYVESLLQIRALI